MKFKIKEKVIYFWKHLINSPFAIQNICLSIFVLFLSSFQPLIEFDQNDLFPDFSFSENYAINDGYLVNQAAGISSTAAPITERNEIIEHNVREGDTVNSLSEKFSLDQKTLELANNITIKNPLISGKKIRIPRTYGIFHKVKSNETLNILAEDLKSKVRLIKEFNNIKNNIIKVGQELFIPQESTTAGTVRKITYNKRKKQEFTYSTQTKAKLRTKGLKFLWPTKGLITQRFNRNHFALDIANSKNTPIYATESGKVIKSSGGWNYGYGEYIVIDHGNKTQTLYSHMNTREVQIGASVKRGQLIGKMGNTGKVFGITGVHLHYEIHINGRKVNPILYLPK